MRVITLKLTGSEISAVEFLVKHGYYKSRTEFLRKAMLDLLGTHKLKKSALKAIEADRKIHGLRKRKSRYSEEPVQGTLFGEDAK